jgi:hypothetical protein
MREANDRGYECLLIGDATESYFPEFKRSTPKMIRARGAIVGWTAPLAALRAATWPRRPGIRTGRTLRRLVERRRRPPRPGRLDGPGRAGAGCTRGRQPSF